MTSARAFQANRANIRETQFADIDLPPLAEGQVLAHIDNFALTANNITYGAIGDMIGYWLFYPAQDPYGHIPVWGFATVTESKRADVPVGTRFSGFLPMATHVILQPDRVSDTTFTDVTPHRTQLPPVYNNYTLAGAPDEKAEAMANLFRPLFTTSFLIDDFFADNDAFGAQQIILASASSKTALGAAFLMKDRPVKTVGLTSARNKAFVENTGYYDSVLTYDEIGTLKGSGPSVLSDMGGNGQVIADVHHTLGDDLKFSSIVGATHWDKMGPPGALPGPKPVMFFAPDLIVKRNKDWGVDGFNERVGAATTRFYASMESWLDVQRGTGEDALLAAYKQMVEGAGNPAQGHVLSI